jgi:hypothetical protein
MPLYAVLEEKEEDQVPAEIPEVCLLLIQFQVRAAEEAAVMEPVVALEVLEAAE